MATQEELVQTRQPVEPMGSCDLFVGLTGVTDVAAVHAQMTAALAGLQQQLGTPSANPFRITIAYPGLDSTHEHGFAEAGEQEDAGSLDAEADGAPLDGVPVPVGSSDDPTSHGVVAEATRTVVSVHPLTPRSTPVRFISYPLPAVEGVATPWSIGAASQRSLLGLAATSQAKVCVLLHPDLQLLTAEGLVQLALPILEKKAELVVPVYSQRPFDGLLNNSILAPLTRALYGKRLHFPLAPDYAVSARLVARLLQSAHSAAHLNAGSILWPATVAATIDGPVAEAPVAVQHATQTEGLDLSAVIAQLIGSMFADMEHNAPLWQRVRGSHVSLQSGARLESGAVAAEPENTPDPKPLIDSFLLGARSLQEVWGLVLPPVTLLELKRLTLTKADKFRLPDELWVRIIYDFALAYRLRVISRTHLLGALTPLYLGWVASYVNELSGTAGNLAFDGNTSAVQRHEQLAKAFEDGKPYLVRRWRWPDRFNP